MDPVLYMYEATRDFVERGGSVLVVIAWVIMFMWTLIIERLLYFSSEHRRNIRGAWKAIQERDDTESWHAVAIRDAWISRISMRLHSGIPLIRTLAALCPLLGLLGTVTGMIAIFDVMAIVGSSSARAVAAGVSTATITTMAGMVGALSGIFPAAYLARRAREHTEEVSKERAAAQAAPPGPLTGLSRRSRVVASFCGAVVVTFLLLFLMEELIVTGKKALTDSQSFHTLDFVRVKREDTIERKILKPDRPETPDQAPEMPAPEQDLDLEPGQEVTGVRMASARTDSLVNVEIGRSTGYGIQEGDYLPLVKVAPIYPRRAASRGLEGWVMLRFTVTASGSVKDVVVIESSDPIFEKAAVQAAMKFKYKPRVVDGIAVEVPGVINRISFFVEEDEEDA